MRSDAVGLFWQDMPVKRGELARVQPPIPDTGWTAPTEFPNLAAATEICVDVETWDPDLLTHGPGWARGRGHIVGVSVGTGDGFRAYYPIRHEIEPETNLDPDNVLAWLRHALNNARQPKIGANLTYDAGWLRQEGVNLAGKLYDVQFAEALLHERNPVALEDLGVKYLGEGKESNLLYQWCADYYGGAATGRQRRNIYRAPPRLVGPYAESDVDLPLRVLGYQWPLLEAERLMPVFQLECGLIPLLLDMRFAGVTVDVDAAEQLREQLEKGIKKAKAKLKEEHGRPVDVWSNASMAKLFDKAGIEYPLTDKGTPSFRAGYLEGLDHPVARAVLGIRRREKIIGTFIDGYILNAHIDGKVYGEFHQLRNDSGGARSGRFSSSNPNLQNIPSRSELGNKIRKIFVPDNGHDYWRKSDYSQIEYRFMAHYSIGDKADDIRRQYNVDPRTDFHEAARELIRAQTGQTLDRSSVKTINFALLYGMGIKSLIARLGITDAEGKVLFNAYHTGAPFVKATFEATSAEAEDTGIIETILGRRSRFDLWEPGWRDSPGPAVPFEKAVRQYAHPRRAYTHKALNRRLQGSAADQIKAAMLRCYEDGVFDVTGVPRLTVHDELDFSAVRSPEVDEGFREMERVMEAVIPLRVPVQVVSEVGPNWGSVEKA